MEKYYDMVIADGCPTYCGFMIGMMSSIISKDMPNAPLSHMFTGCISGFFCSIGADIIDYFFPNRHFRVLFPILTTITGLYYLLQLREKRLKNIVQKNIPPPPYNGN